MADRRLARGHLGRFERAMTRARIYQEIADLFRRLAEMEDDVPKPARQSGPRPAGSVYAPAGEVTELDAARARKVLEGRGFVVKRPRKP